LRDSIRKSLWALVLAGSLSSPGLAADADTLPTPASQITGPANDDFANAETLDSGQVMQPGTIANATRQAGEPTPFAMSLQRTVWYRYVAPRSGRAVVALNTGLGNFPIQLSVYSGTSLADLAPVVKLARTSLGDDTGVATFATSAGKSYFLQIDSAPQSGSLSSSFFIGLQQFGPAGGLAAFETQPQNALVYSSRVILANGLRRQVALTASIPQSSVPVSSPEELAADTAGYIYALSPSSPDWVPAGGRATLVVVASDSTSGAQVATAKRQVNFLGPLDATAPKIAVHFDSPKLGTTLARRIETTAYVANPGDKPVVNCHFDPAHSFAYAVEARLIRTDGSSVSADGGFDLPAHGARRVAVSMRPLPFKSLPARLDVACYNASVAEPDSLQARFAALAVAGPSATLRILPQTDTKLGQVKIAAFEPRRVFVTLTNDGDYSGDFTLVASGVSNQRAVVKSMCEVDAASNCLTQTTTGSLAINVANGETKRMAIDVWHGADPQAAELVLRAKAVDQGDLPAGVGAFWVTPKN